ncbi:MAG: hypothetical protein HOJ16_06610, partial [Candidatus Peribacter sp.]|nr:hypothetical protein [Candidatus Peribacter sp.]
FTIVLVYVPNISARVDVSIDGDVWDFYDLYIWRQKVYTYAYLKVSCLTLLGNFVRTTEGEQENK